MNITKVAAWSELVSSIAVLATLVYLAVQVQQNTSAINALTQQAMVDADLALLNAWSASPRLSLGLAGQGELTDAEKITTYFGLAAFSRSREFHWIQYQNGLLDETTWQAYRNPIPIMSDAKRARDVWPILNKVSIGVQI